VPVAPTAIARSFELGRELPEARVKALLEAGADVAAGAEGGRS
jgi:hypothetical protein